MIVEILSLGHEGGLVSSTHWN